MFKKLLGLLPNVISKKPKRNKDTFFNKLLKEDTNVSMINFFLISTLAVGVILLFVPVIGMLTDIWFNHTMTINMSDMSLYIGAVAAIFAAGGITSSWTEWSYAKYNVPVITEEDVARSEKAVEAIENNNDENNEENNEENSNESNETKCE